MKLGYWVAVVCLIAACLVASSAQTPQTIRGAVVDPQGRPLAGATVILIMPSATVRTVTDESGKFEFQSGGSSAQIHVNVAGFAPAEATAHPGDVLNLQLETATVTQNVVVSATRSAVPEEATASSVRVLSTDQIADTAGLTLDDKLRQIPGFELFRRSSSRVSNPTSQGLSLRGLGSTAASRTLVLSDLIPVNDPFGGWIHWDETPELLIQQVELVRGGGSDLYGSSAIGGVIDIVEHPPTLSAGELQLGYGEENSPEASLIESLSHGPWYGLFSGDFFRTDGYVLVAPSERGTIDSPANVHYQNANLQIERTLGSRGTAFLAGNMLNEARANGTEFQDNATRLWRYSAGFDWNATTNGVVKLRAYGATEHYRQSFSSVAANRDSEVLTRLQSVPTGELGGAVQWLQTVGAHFTYIAGADVEDVRATDFEDTFFHHPTGYADSTGRQRETGVYGEGILQVAKWTVTGSVRYDNFQNLDSEQWTVAKGVLSTLPIPDRSENVGDPRLGVVRRINSMISLTATAFRAFRSPTMNELYRTSQVGQQITLANPDLRSERATGWETGLQLAQPSRNATVRASYFWTEVNRPVTALTVSRTSSSTILVRENLGQIRSRGVSIDYEVAPRPWLTFTGGYQYARATVTRFDQNPALIGNWIPQVPHNTFAVTAAASQRKWGTLSLQVHGSGKQYEDDLNQSVLHSFFRADAYASHEVTRYLEVFISGENLFDRSIEVGRTPVLTLGTPRIVQGGLRIWWKRESQS